MIIGIVTISFNQNRYLQEAIDSVRVSPPHELEYVIVDPGSTDGSRDLIRKNRQRFAHTILEPDQGPADGLNKGFRACSRADVFGYINSDDRFREGALDYVAEYFAGHPETDILFGSIRMIDGDGDASLRGRGVETIDLSRYAAGACGFWQQATFFRRRAFEACGGFNTRNRSCWDSELVIDMLLNKAVPGYTRKALGDFRIYPESLTGSKRVLKDIQMQHVRLNEKIWTAGHRRVSALSAALLHSWYRFSPVRQFGCLAARWM